MPCFSPLTAYYSKEVGKSGKRGVTFDRNAAFSGVPLSLPCGQCVGCRLERSRQWAVRCMHEKSLHTENSFLTLTYDDDHVPESGSLVVRDLQLFMKKLRKKVYKDHSRLIRFYACGEYGETTSRPHYHVLLFNHDFADKKFYKNAKRGEKLYISDELEEVWGQGLCVVGDVSFDSAAYVARYIVKKITGDMAEERYNYVDEDGVYHTRIPEFTCMSRRPGIGQGWFDRYHGEAYTHDSVIMNGVEVRPPRFYDTKYELVDAERLSVLKRKRSRQAWLHRKDNTPDRRRVREIVALKRLKMNRRDV